LTVDEMTADKWLWTRGLIGKMTVDEMTVDKMACCHHGCFVHNNYERMSNKLN